MEQEDFKDAWVSAVRPYAAILDKIKLAQEPLKKMSVLEAVYCTILVKAVEAAHKQDIKDPAGLAAYITGYLSSMGAMPEGKSTEGSAV